MEPANGCRICMEAFLGSVKTPWFGLREGSVIPVKKTAEPSTARHPTSNSTNHRRQGYSESKTYPVVIRSAVHAATRCALAITALHPGFNLRNLAYEEGKNRGSLQGTFSCSGTSVFADSTCRWSRRSNTNENAIVPKQLAHGTKGDTQKKC